MRIGMAAIVSLGVMAAGIGCQNAASPGGKTPGDEQLLAVSATPPVGLPAGFDAQGFRDGVQRELQDNILSFWIRRTPDDARGGFIGRMTFDGQIVPDAPKGLVLNSRILWTFSAAWRWRAAPEYERMARRAFAYLRDYFWDDQYSGAYWLCDSDGQPRETDKLLYGQAFVIYSLAEFYRASGQAEALQMARALFDRIETAAHDPVDGGYFEMFRRDWTRSERPAIGGDNPEQQKSMNAHLHLLEAYTNLYRVWPDDRLRRRLIELIEVFTDHIIDRQTGHFRLFFDRAWHSNNAVISFGHDIEGSWLLPEAAEVLGDEDRIRSVNAIALRMARACLDEALDQDGAMWYEADHSGNIIRPEKHWWPQAETVVGFLNAYQLSGDPAFFAAAQHCWRFIEDHLADRQNGEWHSVVSADRRPDSRSWKVSEWKAPYHNARCCLETLHRLERMAQIP